MAQRMIGVVLVVEDMLQYGRVLCARLRDLLPAPDWEVVALPHEEVGALPPLGAQRVLRAAFVDAHDLNRERQWRRGNRTAVGEVPQLAGGEIARALLGHADKPRVVVYSTAIDDPAWNLALREATDHRATAYYDAGSLLAYLRSALFDDEPEGQYPPPTREELATVGMAADATPLAFAQTLRDERPEAYSLLTGAKSMLDVGRNLPEATRKFLQRQAAKHGLDASQGWPKLLANTRRALGFPKDEIPVRRRQEDDEGV